MRSSGVFHSVEFRIFRRVFEPRALVEEFQRWSRHNRNNKPREVRPTPDRYKKNLAGLTPPFELAPLQVRPFAISVSDHVEFPHLHIPIHSFFLQIHSSERQLITHYTKSTLVNGSFRRGAPWKNILGSKTY